MSKDLYLRIMRPFRKKLRKKMTRAETYLWACIRRERLGYTFLRQVSIGYYVVDFYCKDLNLAIEVDGSIHNKPEIKNRDLYRQKFLENLGIIFLRFSNGEVLYETTSVLETIKNKCHELSQLSSSPPHA
jgi:very-short-patch-repair endonuclease